MSKPNPISKTDNSSKVNIQNIIHVLHVDDEESFLEVSKQLLELQGPFHVENVTSVEEAYKKLSENFDVIVSDYQMPVKDGLQFLKELQTKANNTPFILFTGKGREDVAIEALNLGADYYINKLGNPETVYGELAHAIKRGVNQRGLEHTLLMERQHLETVSRNIGAGLGIISRKYRILWVNKFLKNIFGEISGKLCYSTLNNLAQVCPGCGVKEIFETGKNQVIHEQKVPGIDGKPAWIEIIATPIRDEKGNVTSVLELSCDITERKKAESKVSQYEEIFKTMNDGVVVINPEGILLDINDCFTKMTGWTKEDLIGTNVPYKFWVKEDIPRIMSTLSNLQENDQVVKEFEQLLQKKDGNTIWTRVNSSITYDEKGKQELFFGVFHDIAEKKKTQEELEQIFNLSPDLVCVCTTQGELLKISPSCEKILGYTQEEMLNIGWSSLVHPDDVQSTNKQVEKQLKGGSVANFVNRYRHKDGSYVFLEWQASFAEKGIVHATARDITERKKMESNIEKQNVFLNNTIDSLSHPFYVINADDYTIQLANTASGFDTSKKQLCYEVTHKQNKPCSDDHPCPLEMVKKTKKAVVTEHIHYDKDGKPRNFEVHGYPIFDDDGNVIQMIEYCLNVTERKKVEQTLRSSEERLKILFEFAPDAYYLNDLKGNLVDGNKAAEELTGYSKEELIGKSFLKLKLLSLSQIPKAIKLLAKNALGKSTGPDEFVLKRKDGTQIIAEIRTYPVKIESQTLVLGIARDITARRKADEYLRDSEERFRLTLEAVGGGGWDWNIATGEVYFSDSWLKSLGYKRDEIKPNVDFWQSVVHPDDLSRVMKGVKEHFEGKTVVYSCENRLRMKSGEYRYNLDRGMVVVHDSEGKPLRMVGSDIDITKRKNIEEEKNRILTNYKERVKELHCLYEISKLDTNSSDLIDEIIQKTNLLLSPAWQYPDITCSRIIFENQEFKTKNFKETQWKQHADIKVNGKKVGVVEVYYLEKKPTLDDGPFLKEERNLIDAVAKSLSGIAERKAAEKAMNETFNALAVVNEKLGVVGQITRHDARNKISIIKNYVFLAKKKSANKDVLNYLDKISQASNKTVQIFEFSKLYEQIGTEKLILLDAGEQVEKARALLSEIGSIKVVNECRGLRVLADSLLQEMFYNLMHNSIIHGGQLNRIKVGFVESNGGVTLFYEDDGVGIGVSEKEKVFLKGYGKGSGLGLFLIEKICGVYRWSIREVGVPGKGVKFEITIPKLD